MSYDRFLAHHWPHYNQTFTKGLGKIYSRRILHSADESHEILILFSMSCLVGVPMGHLTRDLIITCRRLRRL